MRKRKQSRQGEYFWQDVLNDWQKSGLSLQQFANERRLRYRTLCRWKKKLISAKAGDRAVSTTEQELSSQPFVPVRLVDRFDESEAFTADVLEGPVLEVLLECGRVIRICSADQVELLSRVVSVLKSVG